jgi:hypothetical protein
MTVIDATIQALRELGMSEEELKQRTLAADLKVTPDRTAEIAPGKEREYIEATKRQFFFVQSLSPLERTAMLAELEERTSKLNKVN